MSDPQNDHRTRIDPVTNDVGPDRSEIPPPLADGSASIWVFSQRVHGFDQLAGEALRVKWAEITDIGMHSRQVRPRLSRPDDPKQGGSIADFGRGKLIGRAPREKPSLHRFMANDPPRLEIGLGAFIGGFFRFVVDDVEQRRFGLGHAMNITGKWRRVKLTPNDACRPLNKRLSEMGAHKNPLTPARAGVSG